MKRFRFQVNRLQQKRDTSLKHWVICSKDGMIIRHWYTICNTVKDTHSAKKIIRLESVGALCVKITSVYSSKSVCVSLGILTGCEKYFLSGCLAALFPQFTTAKKGDPIS